MVHGDIFTTFAVSLAAFCNKVPVGHVEARLCTYNKYSPCPKGINRLLTGNIAEMHFAPIIKNKENIMRENITESIYITENTVIDAIKHTVPQDYISKNPQLRNVDFSSGRYILMTAHRRENIGERLENICRAVKRLVEDFEDLNIIYPVHLNPAVREVVDSIIGNTNRIYLIDPIDVEDMHNLMDKSYMIMTDLGGL